MLAGALLLLLPADPAHLLILGGGKTEADAAKAKAAFTRHADVTPTPGYPKTLKSDTIAGLKPGFHILVLGACPPDAWTLDEVRGLYDGSYIRAVQWQGSLPCPTSKKEPKLGATRTLKVRDRSVRVRVGAGVTVVELEGASGPSARVVLTEAQLAHFGEAGCTLEGPEVRGRRLVIPFACDVPDCTTLGRQEGEARITVAKKGLRLKLRKGKYTPGQCD